MNQTLNVATPCQSSVSRSKTNQSSAYKTKTPKALGCAAISPSRVSSFLIECMSSFRRDEVALARSTLHLPPIQASGPGGSQAILQTLLVSLDESFDQGGSKALSIENLLLNIDMRLEQVI